MNPANLPWLLEFALESTAAVLSFRKKNWTLFALVAFRALADFATFGVRNLHSDYLYAVLFWVFRAGQYLLLIWLACVICGKLLSEFDQVRVRMSVAVVAMIGAAVALKVFSDAQMVNEQFMDAEISANFLLAVVLLAGLISRNLFWKRLEFGWSLITFGLVIQLASRALCTILWMRFDAAAYWFYAGDIITLSVWIAGAWWKEEEIQVMKLDSLGSPKTESLIPGRPVWLDESSKMEC